MTYTAAHDEYRALLRAGYEWDGERFVIQPDPITLARTEMLARLQSGIPMRPRRRGA